MRDPMRNVDAFIRRWTDVQERKRRDIEAVLRERVEERRPDLTADDKELSQDAAEEISEIFDHLSGPLPPLSKAERQKLAFNAIQHESLSAAERRKLRKRVQRATGRPRAVHATKHRSRPSKP